MDGYALHRSIDDKTTTMVVDGECCCDDDDNVEEGVGLVVLQREDRVVILAV